MRGIAAILACILLVIGVITAIHLLQLAPSEAANLQKALGEAQITEVGHMVYMRLNLRGDCDTNMLTVMRAMDAWQKANEGKELIDVEPICFNGAYQREPWTWGVTLVWKDKPVQITQ